MKKRRLSFGKYKGKTVDWVIKNDSSYIRWVLDNAVQGFTLTPNEKLLVIKLYDKPKRTPYQYNYDEESSGHLYNGLSEYDYIGER